MKQHPITNEPDLCTYCDGRGLTECDYSDKCLLSKPSPNSDVDNSRCLEHYDWSRDCASKHAKPKPEPLGEQFDWLQSCLDQLATTVHNLHPGDIGSFDRVLFPIALAKQEIIDTYAKVSEQTARSRELQVVQMVHGRHGITCDKCFDELKGDVK